MTHRYPALCQIVAPLALTLSAAIAQEVTATPTGAAPAMERYVAALDGTSVEIPMIPIPVGTDGYPATFEMGSPAGEDGRNADEGPQFEVAVEPFWIGQYEVTWDTFDEFRRAYAAMSEHSLRRADASDVDWADAVSLPTPLYEQDTAPILNGMGTRGGYPVANITHFAARQFTKWLSKRTGHFYRLPTEAEWEYAARAGTTTAFSFGDDPAGLDDHAIYFDNSAYDDVTKGHPDFGSGYRKVGSQRPNGWGLHDMHGNVAEWVIDQYVADGYREHAGGAAAVGFVDAVAWPEKVFPCVARGGSWDSDPAGCRSAARLASRPKWQDRDPQFPKSIWWFTDGFHVGFRIVRPKTEPPEAEKLRFWESTDESTVDILHAGGKEVRARVDTGGRN